MSLIGDRYWDSNAFLGWLDKVPGRFLPCDAVIKAAERGECRIVTSTITWSEVFWMRIKKDQFEQIATIDELFGKSWIVPIELDKHISQLSRELLYAFARNNGLKPSDSVHLASAIRARVIGGVECFDTWDGGLQALQGQLTKVRGLGSLDSGADLKIGPAPDPQPDLLSGLAPLIDKGEQDAELEAAVLSALSPVLSPSEREQLSERTRGAAPQTSHPGEQDRPLGPPSDPEPLPPGSSADVPPRPPSD